MTNFKSFRDSKTFRIIISVLVAFVVWFYVGITDTAPREMKIDDAPVEFIGEASVLMERGLMMAGYSTDSVDLVLSGTRSILNKLDPDEVYLQVDLTGITSSGQHSLNYKLVLPDSITANMVTLKQASPYRITVEIVDLYTKSIPVKGERIGSPADGYMAGEMSFDTDSIVVSGEQLAVSNISHALVSVDLTDASDNVVTAGEFKLIDFNGNEVDKSQFRTNVENIQVTVPILQIKKLPLTVEFIESPGSTLSDIEWDLSVDEITVAGTRASLANLDKITLTKVDLSTVTQDTTFTIEIPVPAGATNLSGEETADLTIHFKDGIETEVFTVTDIAAVGVPEGFEADLVTNSVDVTLRGPADELAKVSDYNIRIVGDLSDIEGSAGSYAIPATIYVDGVSNVGAVGTYQITVQMRSA